VPLWQARVNQHTNYFIGQTATAPTALTMPAKVQLTTTIGTATALGTVVSGGSYTDQTIAAAGWTASSGASAASNSGALTYSGMPAIGSPGVQGVNLIDSTGTPVNLASGALSAAKTTNSGDTVTIAAAALTVNIQ
jgi:hypothetical protein